MYLQRLEDIRSSHTNWPTDCVEKPATLTLLFDELDATLNSWKETHTAFEQYQGAAAQPKAVAHREFIALCRRAMCRGGRGVSNYGTEILAHALLKVWIANREG